MTNRNSKIAGWKAEMQNERREAAELRQEERDKRSPQEQIEHLDEKLGKGVGARKERARLQKQMEKK